MKTWGISPSPCLSAGPAAHIQKKPVNQAKWGIFSMWCLATVGMALYTANKTEISIGQIQILFSPFFTAFGTAFVLNLIARHSKEAAPVLRGGVLLPGAAGHGPPLLLNLPQIVRVGILTAHRGHSAWPPYYPLGISQEVRNQTQAGDFILTDQPAAVSWYADRKTLDIPSLVSHFTTLERVLSFHGGKVGSILVTPSSTMGRDIRAVSGYYGEFAPLVLEGSILGQTRDKKTPYTYSTTAAPSKLAERLASQTPANSSWART